jgi:hypothetical protein
VHLTRSTYVVADLLSAPVASPLRRDAITPTTSPADAYPSSTTMM